MPGATGMATGDTCTHMYSRKIMLAMSDAAGIAKYCRRPIGVRQLTLTIIDWLARALPCAGTSLAQVCSIESRELLANAARPHDATFQRLQGSPP